MRIFRKFVVAFMLTSAAAAWAAPTPETCRELRFYRTKSTCFEALTRSTEPAVRAEGFWGLEQYDEANAAFKQAVAQPQSGAAVRVRWGLLFHERFNNQEADNLFAEALKIDPNFAPAYLGMAMVSADGFDAKAEEFAARAIAIDPKLTEAHEFMANLALENQKQKLALEEADKALALSDQALEAMAIHAAVEVLGDRKPDAWFAKISAVDPVYGEGYALVGYHLILNRRYEDGVTYYRKAVEVEPRLWAAHSQLGINLMRLGKEEEPLKELELAYDNGQKDAATVNSLRLLESYKTFVTYKDDSTILRLRKNEAELLQPYFSAELHQAIATYNKKYKMTLPGPVQLEVYPDHEDFAVRTMGMPGLGALGVTFGEVVAMDSPSGRKPGDFNWGATLWHEMSHVYILTATNHRVPRWFTEGLAVHEEGQRSAEWASRLTPEVLVAIRDKKLLPVADMDRGFIFPEYPTQVLVSYFEAGSVCDFIQQRWGDDALLGMVHSFAALKTTPEAVQENLKVPVAEFDKMYMAWLLDHAGQKAENFDKFREGLKQLAVLSAAKQNAATMKQAVELLKLYPEYVGDASVYEFLSGAQLSSHDRQGAIATLTAYEKAGGESPAMLKQLALQEEEAGDKNAAAATLDHMNYIYPEDEDLHRKLGALWLELGNNKGAVREFTAVLALKPLDKASAEYALAQAYFADGDRAKAEENVLAALEVAPGFRPAQKLLMQIEGKQ